MTLQGSYANGFAPRDGQPLYPELWRGCVGAWAPCLGPTGLTLRDWSGYANHGTLRNMEGADWSLNRGYTLDFDGLDEYVDCGAARVPAGNIAWSFWLWNRASGVNAGIVYDDASIVGVRYNNANNLRVNTTPANLYLVDASVATNTWIHYAISVDGTTMTTFKNGVLFNQQTVVACTGMNNVNIGWLLGASADRYWNGYLDDIRIYRRALSSTESLILSRRRGIAYDLASMRRSSVFMAGGFKAYWAARKAQIIGGGL